ncbi:hypothetical protein Trydic_g11832 [Trypoxylus dichotomus]
MLKSSVALLIFLAVASVVVSRPKDCDPDKCSRVRCYYVDRDACDPASEVFVPRDGRCVCCDTCVAIERFNNGQ